MGHQGIGVGRDISVEELRKRARREKDGRVASRIFALANVLEGMDRETAARQAGMTRQTLRDWVHRYNAEGLAGLKDRPKGHPERLLTKEQEEELKALVLKGPEEPLVRWRCIDLQAVIRERFKVECHERTVGKILRRLDFARLSVRPEHPEGDREAQEDFKKTLPRRSPKSFPGAPMVKSLNYGSRTRQGSGRKAH